MKLYSHRVRDYKSFKIYRKKNIAIKIKSGNKSIQSMQTREIVVYEKIFEQIYKENLIST